jgi:hypothetical protein
MHRIRVDAAWIVVFSYSLGTISVLFPEGNGGGIVGCRFKRYLLNAIRGERPLGLPQHHGANAVTTVRFEDVDGDDVAPVAGVGGKDESSSLVPRLGHQAVGSREAKVVAEVAARICDSRLIACLVDCIERLEIPGLIFSETKSRGHKCVCATKKRPAKDEDGRATDTGKARR